MAAIIACAVNTDGRREILGLGVGESEAKEFWLEFLRGLRQRGLTGVKLVISDAHEGLKAAMAQVFAASGQRCRVHFMRNLLACVPKVSQAMVSALINRPEMPTGIYTTLTDATIAATQSENGPVSSWIARCRRGQPVRAVR